MSDLLSFEYQISTGFPGLQVYPDPHLGQDLAAVLYFLL